MHVCCSSRQFRKRIANRIPKAGQNQSQQFLSSVWGLGAGVFGAERDDEEKGEGSKEKDVVFLDDKAIGEEHGGVNDNDEGRKQTGACRREENLEAVNE